MKLAIRFKNAAYPFQTSLPPLPTGFDSPSKGVTYPFGRGGELLPKGYHTPREGVVNYPGRSIKPLLTG
jgi:hypothetical protein